MKIVFLGTNNWFDSSSGNTICTLIETRNAYLILDAGFGLHRAKKYVKKDKPIFLFLSHVHIDHICGLHGMSAFYPKQGLTIYCRQGDKKNLTKIIAPPFSSHLGSESKHVKIIEIKKNKKQQLFNFETALLNHTVPTLGYRFEIENKIISYCMDTGFSKQSIQLSQQSDILIHECSLAPKAKDGGWGHSSPEIAAKIAKVSKTKKLILTGFGPDYYVNKKTKIEAERYAKKIFKNTIAAFDKLVVKI